jgi:ABC-type multidrug transport system fused ATPase/permease subunit
VNVPGIVREVSRRTDVPRASPPPAARPAEASGRAIDAPAGPRRAAEGRQSESFRAANASQRPPAAGRRLFVLFLVYVATIVALNLATRVGALARNTVARHMTIRLRDDLHRKILGLTVGYQQSTTPGRLMARILSDVDALQAHLLDVSWLVVTQTAMLLVGFAILFSLDWKCALVVFLVAIPYFLVMRKARLGMRFYNREIRHTNACLWGFVSQKIDAIKAIFAYGREKTEILDFFRLSAAMQRDTLASQRISATTGGFAQVLSALATQGIFLYCTLAVLDGRMSLGRMMFIHGAAVNLFAPVVALTQAYMQCTFVLVIMQRLSSMLENPHQIEDAPDAVDFPCPIESAIAAEHLTFRYAPGLPPALLDIHLTVPKGKWVCIMGPSGSGKTTLLNLFARLCEPSSGRIAVDGIDLADIRQSSLHSHMALVPQEAQIIGGTVRDNIVYGRPRAEPAEIMAAAQAADCHDFILKLPVQYETVVGERGTTLSGGQRQRISIARALLTRPEVLLLDDCTSALDAATEQKIQETLAKLMAGKTAIIVSQRVSMAMRCDRIVVIEDGTITERGTHAELLQHDGFYSRLVATQTGKEADGEAGGRTDPASP